MSARHGFCENRDGIICQGVNGFKNIVGGFVGFGDKTSAPPTPSDTQTTPATPKLVTSAPQIAGEGEDMPPPLPLPPPPPPPEIITAPSPPGTVTLSVDPPASIVTAVVPPPLLPGLVLSPPQEPSPSLFPQLILPTPVLLTSTLSRGSFIVSLPTKTASTLNPVNNPLVPSIFASSDFQSPVLGPVTNLPAPPTETGIATPLISPDVAQGAIEDRSTTFPAALVAGVSGGAIAFIFIFALLWRYYLRQQSQRRHAHSLADEKGTFHTQDNHRDDPPFDRSVTTQIWTGSRLSKSDQTRLSWAETEVSLGTELEPLSPKPVIQQTVHKMSVPRPVEASSFRGSSKEGSMRGSISRPASTNQQRMSREAPAEQGSDSTERLSTRLQTPGTDHLQEQQDLHTQPEENEGDPEPSLLPAPLQKKARGTGLRKHYTLKTSPLHQNPFRDPDEEDSPVGTPESLTFEIVNADTSLPGNTPDPDSGPQVTDRPGKTASPIRVLETITLTAEDLRRASTAKSVFARRTRRE